MSPSLCDLEPRGTPESNNLYVSSFLKHRQLALTVGNFESSAFLHLMEGEWNEENWFDLANYADIDMDAGFDYEPSDASSDDDAAPGDLSPRDFTTDGVEEGSLSPTTIRPNEEPASSEGKGLYDHDKGCPKVGSGHDEGPLSKCSSPPKAVRSGKTSSRSRNSRSSSTPGGSLSPVSPAKDAIEHALPASSTIPTQGSPTDGDGYNPKFPFLEGFAPSR